jgi:hypothetical protein
MTQNRKAELQRKLAMAPVAKPPDGLADRIKSEIPAQLRFEPETERARLQKSVAFSLRIAASIVLLVSSLYLALHLLSHSDSNSKPATMLPERSAERAPSPVIVPLPNTPPQPGSMHAKQPEDLPALPSSPPAAIAAAQPKARMAEAKHAEAVGMMAGSPAYVDEVQTPAAAAEQIAIAKAAPALAASGGERAPDRDERSMATAKVAAAPAAAPAPLPPAPPLARDAAPAVRNFVALAQAIAQGEEPRNIDLAAIVRHFSAPASAPSDLRVEIEASATPLDATKWLLRVSVDAPASTSMDIDVTFGGAVAVHRALTGAPAPNETALYEIEFSSSTNPDQAIASVRAGGVQRSIRVRDLHPWNSASPRMKRASLAAAWARTLQSHTPADAIVAKAREEHFDDLADLAERAERNR